MKPRYYLGLNNPVRDVFKADVTPTAKTHSQYLYVVGPFRTKRGAEYMRDNKWTHSVDHAEDCARGIARDKERAAKEAAAGC